MSASALLNPESFRRRIGSIIEDAVAVGRGEDLDRIVAHVFSKSPPSEVSRLAALMYMVDQEYLLPLQEALDAFRRWHEKKQGTPPDDDDVLEIMREVYASTRTPGRTA